MASRDGSQLQLLEVSRGAHKLAHMIESWSKAQNLDGQSENITKDLPRGALDLQESLDMLERLQCTSKQMAMEKDKSRIVSMGVGSKRFAINGNQNDMREAQLSLDRSSKDCSNELKKTIKDSFMRQNLLSASSDNEKASSTRSLRFLLGRDFDEHRHDGMESTVKPVLIRDQAKKSKAPSLIAKLMGLEDAPLEVLQPPRIVEHKRISKQPGPVLDFEMPTTRRLQLVEQHRDTDKKMLQEIIESMQSKGILKDGLAEETRYRSRHTDPMELYESKLHNDDDIPSIVIMKPLKLPYPERHEVPKDVFINRILVHEKVRSVKLVKEEKFIYQERKFSKNLETRDVESMDIKVLRARKYKYSDAAYKEAQRKEAIKVRKEVVRSKKPLQDGKKLEEKTDRKAIKETVSSARSLTSQVRHDHKVSLAKHSHATKTSIAKERNMNSQVKPKSQSSTDFANEKKTTSAKPIRNSTVTKAANGGHKKRQEHRKKISPPGNVDGVSLTGSRSLADEENVAQKANQDSTPRNNEDETEDQEVVLKVTVVSPKTETTEISSDFLLAEDEIKDQEGVLELMSPMTNSVEISSDLAEDSAEYPGKADFEAVAEDDNLTKAFLLSSESFLSQAQLLFGLDTDQITHCPRKSTEGIETRDAKLFLDFAEEVMSCKSYQQELSWHPMWRTNAYGSIVCPSIYQLLEEISNQMENLTSYSEIKNDVKPTSEDSLYVRLEKDIKCNNILTNAVREMDWSNWVCMVEVEQLVGVVEEHIFSSLIGEIAMDFVY